MNNIKAHWKEIVIILLILFGLNKCTVACNRDTKNTKQATEIIQKDSIIKVQADSLNILKIRWDENQKGQVNYQNLATGTKQELINQISSLNNEIKNLKIENKKLKELIKNNK